MGEISDKVAELLSKAGKVKDKETIGLIFRKLNFGKSACNRELQSGSSFDPINREWLFISRRKIWVGEKE